MIGLMRSIGVRLWISALFSLPLTLYLLPKLSRIFPDINPYTTCLGILGVVMVAGGFFMRMAGKKAVTDLIREGQAWERSEIFNKAEKSFIKAVRVYDSFLFWPFSNRQTAGKLSRAVARFNLNGSVDNQNFYLAAVDYLGKNPDDINMAELWLKKLARSAAVTDQDEEILTVLAEKYYAHKGLSDLLSKIFLIRGRKDFAAKRVFQNTRKGTVFEPASSNAPLSGIGRSEETLRNEVYSIEPAMKHKGVRIQPVQYLFRGVGKAVHFVKGGISGMGTAAGAVTASVGSGYQYMKNHEKARFYLKLGFMVGVSLCLGFLVLTTVSHMLKSRTVEIQKVAVDMPTPKPFTIQVAAYLKQESADHYVDLLKKKGIDAAVKKVAGGGKTWFVVRVSEFEDKQSAEAYGQTLKQQKIIDDFFVNNR